MARQEPQNKDAEISVLGCGFLEKTALDRILDEVTEEMFYDEANRIIFKTADGYFKTIGGFLYTSFY